MNLYAYISIDSAIVNYINHFVETFDKKQMVVGEKQKELLAKINEIVKESELEHNVQGKATQDGNL